MTRQFSPAFERNREPIAAVLEEALTGCRRVLEVGSGSGQHAAWFGSRFPEIHWTPTDLPGNLAGIDAWVEEAGVSNVDSAVALDLLQGRWTVDGFDAVVAVNVVHIVSWTGVQNLFRESGRLLPQDGVLFLYGPFRYPDREFEPSNERFDRWLRDRDPQSGVRDFPAVDALAAVAGLKREADRPMPANNRSIWWRKRS